MNHIEKQIWQLEIELLHTDMRENPALLDELLAEEFEEISNNGTLNSRQSVINWLLNKDRKDHWQLTHFRVRLLSADWVLAIYQARKENDSDQSTKGSTRSSIWKRHHDSWQMVFHQGSKID